VVNAKKIWGAICVIAYRCSLAYKVVLLCGRRLEWGAASAAHDRKDLRPHKVDEKLLRAAFLWPLVS